jgi:hypothetical protein
MNQTQEIGANSQNPNYQPTVMTADALKIVFSDINQASDGAGLHGI